MSKSKKDRRHRKAKPPPIPPTTSGAAAPPGTEPRPLKNADAAAERARLMEKAQEIIELAPGVRAEKVAALKEAVEQGTYQIDSRRLAEIILALLLTEE